MTEFPITTIQSCDVNLADYAILDYHVNDAASELHGTSRTLSLEIQATDVVAEERKKTCKILLVISVGGAEFSQAKSCPLSMHIEGLFEAPPELANEVVLERIASYGVQELFAISKAFLATLTTGSSAGKIVLPSVRLGRE